MTRAQAAREVWRLTQEGHSLREAAKRISASGYKLSANTAGRMLKALKEAPPAPLAIVKPAATASAAVPVQPAASPAAAQSKGRPTVCTPELIAEAEDAAYQGMKNALIADYIGICERSFYTWLKKGQAQDGGVYRRFVQAIKKGRARRVNAALDRINSDDSWQSAAWLLERAYGYRRDEPAAAPPAPTVDPGLRKMTTAELLAELDVIEGGAA